MTMNDEGPAPGSDVNPATSVITAALGAVHRAIVGVADTLQRMETRQSPGLFTIPDAFPASYRLRSTFLVFSVSAAATVALRVGSADVAAFVVPSEDTRVIPFPYTFDRGAEITLTTTAGVATGFLLGFTE